MKVKKIKPVEDGLINVIIETPKESQNKFDYDTKLGIFRLKKTLPMGTMFPFDFGFIPNTKAEDGDPVDVLVIMDQHAFPGCLVQCRLLGVLKAIQKEKGGKEERNDRLVAVTDCSILYADLKKIKDINKHMIEEIENFFIDYNKHEGKKFEPIKWGETEEAMKVIKKHKV
ncbi:MAG: inorganic diphosphatase [Bacteroidetes bacterium]|nr:inorganic diphosphatase [Bacteroidota bacterium]